MKKIVLIGSGGSGKSTLASKLGGILSIEVHHLDVIFWKPGWISTPKLPLPHSTTLFSYKAFVPRSSIFIFKASIDRHSLLTLTGNFSSIHNVDEAAAAIGSFIALTGSIFQSSCIYARDNGNIL
ncbi:GTPase SAR1 family protein [Paenibacillus endophyticus]|uniref:GTPase SAR1 family protein n=1 Tax=Paenibacillus endophyticus TaxID=1294268 RepID=A0A7W5G8W1_9BACL|nr:GTPase SAR1 family protein [Paenibacillus endophyticus]